jgi:hypothetical protein
MSLLMMKEEKHNASMFIWKWRLCFSEKLVSNYEAAWRHTPEDINIPYMPGVWHLFLTVRKLQQI